VDIISFDAASYLDKVLLYRGELREFFHRGGSLAWGVVPTTGFTGSETADGLVDQLEAEAAFRRRDRPERDPASMSHHSVLRTGEPGDGTGGSDPEADECHVGQDAEKDSPLRQIFQVKGGIRGEMEKRSLL
jgi:hypothetical protein